MVGGNGKESENILRIKVYFLFLEFKKTITGDLIEHVSRVYCVIQLAHAY